MSDELVLELELELESELVSLESEAWLPQLLVEQPGWYWCAGPGPQQPTTYGKVLEPT